MTRINVGILPSELSDKHLLAEHREIKRIPNNIMANKVVLTDIPKEFTLGKGHVKFFYNKQMYLLRRYSAILAECQLRGFNVTNYLGAWVGIPKSLCRDYEPTLIDRAILITRLKEKDPIHYANITLNLKLSV